MFYLLLVAGISFPRYVFSVLLGFFVRLDFAFSAPVCPRFVVWKRFSHLVRRFGIGILASYAPMTMNMNIVCSSIHLVPVLQTNLGYGRNPPSPCQDFSSLSERSRITATVFSFSSFFFFYTPFVDRFRRHASYA